jgi:hypothetical protein
MKAITIGHHGMAGLVVRLMKSSPAHTPWPNARMSKASVADQTTGTIRSDTIDRDFIVVILKV